MTGIAFEIKIYWKKLMLGSQFPNSRNKWTFENQCQVASFMPGIAFKIKIYWKKLMLGSLFPNSRNT